jgi:DNA-binding CsgD family transcriptional regulator
LLEEQLRQYGHSAQHVADIFRPLQSVGMAGFYYMRFYPTGEFINITMQPYFAELCLRRLFAHAYSPESVSDYLFIEKGVSLWELSAHNQFIQDAKHHFSYGNGIALTESQAGYQEFYNFYAMSDQPEMSAFYLKQIDFLRKFKAYFVKKAGPIIAQAEQDKFLMPEPYRSIDLATEETQMDHLLAHLNIEQNKKPPLSPRELECLLLVSQGLSAIEVANELCLSRRTVENYIANLKSKWHCSKISELIYLATGIGLLGKGTN